MSKSNKIQLFEKQTVRTYWDDEQEKWYFSVQDVVQILSRAAMSAHSTYAGASSSSGSHYTTGLWAVEFADDIAAFLKCGEHKVRSWVERHRHINVFFPKDSKGCDPFFNVNTPEDVVSAERMR